MKIIYSHEELLDLIQKAIGKQAEISFTVTRTCDGARLREQSLKIECVVEIKDENL